VLKRDPAVYVNAIVTEPERNFSSFFDEATKKCSSWHTKIRRIAFILRITTIWKLSSKAKTRATKATIPSSSCISKCELERAEILLITEIQYKHFALEIDALRKSSVNGPDARGHVTKKSKSLRPHNPFVDKDGVLRVGSRILKANIASETKFPAILPPKDDVTITIIRHFHEMNHHAGPKFTLAASRQRYWINKGLQTTKSVIHRCMNCQRNFKSPMTQKMAPLPAE
jgi:hypothetical protein